jgi:hypothetical protein
MLFSKEYVGYLAREVTKKLLASGKVETKQVPALTEKVHATLLEELALEDRINDEVRVILEAYSEEMQKTGADYQEMFRKVKSELVKKYKAVL